MELEPDDPRTKWIWQFTIQTEELDDGSWRAWYPSGGWSVTGPTEDTAKARANEEGIRLREDPAEVGRRVAIMRQHLVAPVPGVANFDKSELASAWTSDDPAAEVRRLLGELGSDTK